MKSRRAISVAVVGVMGMMVARGTVLEGLRDPFGVTPGSKAYPAGTGPGAGLVMDLLCCMPALLVLFFGVLKKSAGRRRSWACSLAALLALWAGGSALWADDKFAAVVGAAHLVAAFSLLWAARQIITSWGRLRLVAAVCQGLLLVYVTQAALYRYVELPATVSSYEKNKAEFLQERGWQAGDFMARQFEIKLLNGEMLGFHGSSNSFAAALVLLMGVCAGVLIQRVADGEKVGATGAGVAILLGAWIVYYTRSKAAFVTPLMIIGVLLLVWRGKRWLSYWGGVVLVVAGIAGGVGYGLLSGGLPGASLNFRWRYWTAAWAMFRDHPWVGVGWDNFGMHYLRYRLPAAAEEIQDPHNFFVRCLTELGIVGAVLVVAWLGRLWWEMTRSVWPQEAEEGGGAIGLISCAALVGLTVNALASIDWNTNGGFIFIEIMKRALFFCVLVVGASVAALRSLKRPVLEERAAPWVLYATAASLGAFLVHNLIEFSLFETGPLMVFAVLAGSVLGTRSQAAVNGRGSSAAMLIVGGCAWVAAGVGLVIPVAAAEGLAHQGDDLVREGNLDQAADVFSQAYQQYVSFNSDYLYRAALALAYKPGEDRAAARAMLDRAIAENPSVVFYYLSRARLDVQMRDAAAVQKDFSKALELDPNEVSIHREFGDVLMGMGMAGKAAEQYQAALKYNDLLPTEEPKRVDDGAIEKELERARAVK